MSDFALFSAFGWKRRIYERYNKDDIVQDFAVLHGINQETARLYFDSFATLIAEGLNTNGKVHIKYLGTFQKKTVPARKLYNFHTKEPVDVPEHGGIRFIPSESLRKDVY